MPIDLENLTLDEYAEEMERVAMAEELRRLLELHAFLDLALRDHAAAMAPEEAKRLVDERDAVLLRLVRLPAKVPEVALAQIDLLLSSLVAMATRPAEAEALRTKCLETVARLTSQNRQHLSAQEAARTEALARLSVESGSGRLPQGDARLLDCLTDRAALLGPDYRFLFTNAANAAYHGIDADDLVGVPNWALVGARCFRELTKPTVDACFAGRSISLIATHDADGAPLTYAVSVDPVRNAKGTVTAALVIARDVTRAAPKSDVVWPRPDA